MAFWIETIYSALWKHIGSSLFPLEFWKLVMIYLIHRSIFMNFPGHLIGPLKTLVLHLWGILLPSSLSISSPPFSAFLPFFLVNWLLDYLDWAVSFLIFSIQSVFCLCFMESFFNLICHTVYFSIIVFISIIPVFWE